MQIKQVGKYRFEKTETNGIFYVKVYNTNCKSLNSLKKHYQFSSETQADEYIANTIKGIKGHEKAKATRRAEEKAKRNAFINPAKVGDILYSTWGYEQTNVDFYQVVAVTKKSVKIREIYSKIVETTAYMQADVTAVKDSFKKDSETLTKRVNEGSEAEYFVSIASYANAYLWDGKPVHETSYA